MAGALSLTAPLVSPLGTGVGELEGASAAGGTVEVAWVLNNGAPDDSVLGRFGGRCFATHDGVAASDKMPVVASPSAGCIYHARKKPEFSIRSKWSAGMLLTVVSFDL